MPETISDALLKNAYSAHQRRDFVTARALYQQILDDDPTHTEAWHHLGLIEKESGNIEQALLHIKRALSINPQHTRAYYNLGLCYHEVGLVEEARQSYLKGLLVAPDYAPLHNNLGVVYQYLGEHTLAQYHFQRAITLDPSLVEAYYNNTYCDTAVDQERLLRTVLDLDSRTNLSRQDRARVHFTLGKIYDDMGQYELAISAIHKANELVYQPFDIDTFEKEIDTLIGTFTPALFSKSFLRREAGERYAFIAGMPRSGTTLVEQILASHSATYSLGEYGALAHAALGLSKLYPTAGYPIVLQQYDMQGVVLNTKLSQIEFPPHKRLITDKAITNFLHLGLAKLIYPEAKLIHIERDAKDVCLSCYFHQFSQSHSYSTDLETLGQFYRAYRRMMNHWQELLGDHLLTLKYETLVEEQENKTREFLTFCGLEFEESCLRFHETQRVVRSASHWQVRKPMYRSAIGRWKNYAPYLEDLWQGLGEKPLTE